MMGCTSNQDLIMISHHNIRGYHNPNTHSISIITTRNHILLSSHEIINTICTRHDNTIITGHFNCRYENFGHDTADKHGKLIIQYTEDNNFTKLNDNEPTYIDGHTGREDVKDLIFASPTMMKSFKDFWVDEDLGSDHRTTNSVFSTQLRTQQTPKTNPTVPQS